MPKFTKLTTREVQTHYEVLGLPQTCTVEQIKSEYKRVQLRHHPDKTGSLPENERRTSEAISKAANVAYEVLLDPDARRRYDQGLFGTSSYIYPPGSKPSSSSEEVPRHKDKAYASTPEEEQAYPPPPPYAPPKFFPNSLGYYSPQRWRVTVTPSARYTCFWWGPNCVVDNGDNILIYARLADKGETYGMVVDKDVRVSVWETPVNYCISKIDSYYKHRTLAGGSPELHLWIRLYASTNGPPLPFSAQPWSFAWNLTTSHCLPPPGTSTYASSLIFYHDPLEARPSDVRETPHPEDRILQDQDMGPRDGIELVDMGMDVWQVITHGDEVMYRVAAFGYQRV
jgi:hypothetical protein